MGNGLKDIPSVGYITASMVGSLCYGCGFGTPLQMFNRYMGINELIDQPSPEAQESMKFGTYFEDAVAKYFASNMGFKIKRCGKRAYWADDMPYFICHPDRLVIGKDDQGRRVALEIKCVSPYSNGWGESGTTFIPDTYFLQVQSYFACQVPCDVVYVVCMRGNRIYSYEILPDDEIIADIRYRVAKAKKDFDEGKVPNTENYSEAVSYFSNKVKMDADGIGANDEALDAWANMLIAKHDKELAEAREERYKKELVDYMGENPSVVRTEGNKIVKIAYWTETVRNTIDKAKLQEDHPEINLNDYYITTKNRTVRFNYPKKEA